MSTQSPTRDSDPSMVASAAAHSDPLIGTRVAGRYRIERVHQRGGTSVVYAATYEAQQREVAIKMLDVQAASDPAAIERFMHEAETASSLSHGHVVGVSDYGQLPGGRPYLVMPMIFGKDLATLISEQGPLPVSRVARLLAGVASALDAMHEKGLVHRDIKSENLMYVRGDNGVETALVLDFGIAAPTASNDDDDASGTPEFMAPEALVGAPCDHRADVYSLATVAFELLSGGLPFDGNDLPDLVHNKTTLSPRSLWQTAGMTFPPALEAVLARGLERDPSARPSSAGRFVEELSQAAAAARTSAAPGLEPRERAQAAGALKPRPRLPRMRTIVGVPMRNQPKKNAAPRRTARMSVALLAPFVQAHKALSAAPPAKTEDAPTSEASAPQPPPAQVETRAQEPEPTREPQSRKTKPGVRATSNRPPAPEPAPASAAAKPDKPAKAVERAAPKPAPTASPAPPQAVHGAAASTSRQENSGVRRRPPTVSESTREPSIVVDLSLPPLDSKRDSKRDSKPSAPLDSLSPRDLDESELRVPVTAFNARTASLTALAVAVSVVLLLVLTRGSDEPAAASTTPTALGSASPPERSEPSTPLRPEPVLAEPVLAEPVLAEPALAEPALAEPALAPQEFAAAPAVAEPAPLPPDTAVAPPPAPVLSTPAPRATRKSSDSAEKPARVANLASLAPPAPVLKVSVNAGELTNDAVDAMLRGDLQGALATLQTALKASPRHAPAHRAKGLVLERLGRRDDAARAFEQYLRLQPSAPDADKIRARLQAL